VFFYDGLPNNGFAGINDKLNTYQIWCVRGDMNAEKY